jgi:hypothetical protein
MKFSLYKVNHNFPKENEKIISITTAKNQFDHTNWIYFSCNDLESCRRAVKMCYPTTGFKKITKFNELLIYIM